jgi:hypothetical protein
MRKKHPEPNPNFLIILELKGTVKDNYDRCILGDKFKVE